MTSDAPRARKATEQLRDANRAHVLQLVRRGPLSRAELTAQTGLNRSTIGAVVGQLEAEGWLEQAEAAQARPGRPSALVRLTEHHGVLALNPEIDGIDVAVVGLGGQIVARSRISSSRDALEWLDRARRSAAELTGPRRLLGVGIAVPGMVDSDGVVRNAPHLGWHDVPLADAAARVFALPTRVANDAACGGLAERAFGAVSDESYVFLNGGASGVGASLFDGGERVVGANGFAGEWGHTVLNPRGERRSVEELVNKARLEATLGPLDRLDPTSASGPELDEQLDWLALTLGNIVTVGNPSRVALGGFLGWLDRVRPGWLQAEVRRSALAPTAAAVQISAARLGPDALLIGAAELIAKRLPGEAP